MVLAFRNQKNEQEVEPDYQASKPVSSDLLPLQAPPPKDSSLSQKCHQQGSSAQAHEPAEGRCPSNPPHILSLKNVYPHLCQDFLFFPGHHHDYIFLYFTILKSRSILTFSQCVFCVKNQKLPSGEMSLAPPLPSPTY